MKSRDPRQPVIFESGYPTDLRSEELRRRAAAGPYGDFEGRAARVIARATGLHVIIQDDNRIDRTPDFRIESPSADVLAVVEVVTTTRPAQAEQLAAFARGDLQFDSTKIRCTWWATITPSARQKGLRDRLETSFAQLEARGDHELLRSLISTAEAPPEVTQLAQEGIIEIRCDTRARADGIGRIYGLPRAAEAPLAYDWEGCAEWIDAFLCSQIARGKVQKLLAQPGPGARHLYVGVTGDDPWPVQRALHMEAKLIELPRPALAPGISHLWLHNAEFPGRVITYWPELGWVDPSTRWHTA